MLRKKTTCVSVLLAACIFVSVGAAPVDEDQGAAIIQGTWFCGINWAEWTGNGPSDMLVNAGPGGSLMTADTDDLWGFSPELAAAGSFVQGPGFGGWKRSQGHAFDLNYLPLGYSGIGPDAGLFAFICRFRCAIEVRGDLMNGPCSVDVWWAVDPDGDGVPNSPNPATVDPDVVIPDMTQLECTRVPVLPK